MADVSKLMSEMTAEFRRAGYSEEEIQVAIDEYAAVLPGKIKAAMRQAIDRATDAHATQGKTEKYRSLVNKRDQLAGTLEGLKAPPRAGHVQKNKSYRERKKVLEQIDEIHREMTVIDRELDEG